MGVSFDEDLAAAAAATTKIGASVVPSPFAAASCFAEAHGGADDGCRDEEGVELRNPGGCDPQRRWVGKTTLVTRRARVGDADRWFDASSEFDAAVPHSIDAAPGGQQRWRWVDGAAALGG
uniref:Uncharacterized protein n=1 Tax=Oryza meridionalis TaxID=40149 RepID=A0A0E0FB35_9ORYZ